MKVQLVDSQIVFACRNPRDEAKSGNPAGRSLMVLRNVTYRFGPFELRPCTRELYKQGTRLKLRPQSFRVLNALAERSGDVVTREELRRLLWPAETFVDFEHGLNTAIKELRGVLNDSADKPRYIETLPKLGYRFITPVACDLLPTFQGDSIQQAPVTTERAARERTFAERIPQLQGWRWFIRVGIVVALLAAMAACVQWFRSRPQSRAMLAVLPFENFTGDAGQDYFSDGLTEEIIGQLGRSDPQRLGVIARTSVMHYKHTQEPLSQIGRDLGVQYVLEGSVRRDSNRVRISAQLIQMRDQTHVWSRQYDREIGGLLALQDEIAREAADEIQLALGGLHNSNVQHQAPLSAPTSNDAHDLYLRGIYFWNQRSPEGFQQAANYFQQAIAKDPSYARAYSGLANTFGLMASWDQAPQNELMPKARAAALKALQLDETNAEAHTALGLIAENYDYDWQTAEKEFRRAIELDSNYATAHQWYGEYLSWMGRFDEALAESERARQLDPLSLIVVSDRAAILVRARQYDRAFAECRAVLDTDPSFIGCWGVVQEVYVEQGRFQEALDFVAKHIRPRSPLWAQLAEALIYCKWGRTAEAERALARFEDAARDLPFHRDLPINLVQIHVVFGQRDQAIAVLQRAFSEHSHLITALKVDPLYDPLRSDPRFQDLLRRVHLAE